MSSLTKITEIKDRLKPVVGENSGFEARQLVKAAKNEEQLDAWVNRRLKGEPLQYILGEWEFFALPIKVTPSVLIPRADSETLCELAIERIKSRGYKTVLDMCSGSGCLAIAIKRHTDAAVTLSDISEQALKIAGENARLNGVEVTMLNSDLFSNISGKYDCIVCNPPYLSSEDMSLLQNEVRYEPQLALFGGDDGLEFYRRIAADYKKHLNDGGSLLMEIGYNQAKAVSAMFDCAKVQKDICQRDRVIIAEGLCNE